MKGASVSFLISFVLIANLQNTESKKYSLDEIKVALKPVSDICIERVGVNPKIIEDANNGKLVPDRKLQCYYKCVMLMTKVMKNDKIVEKALQNIVELMLVEELQTIALGALKHCQSTLSKSMEGCELAYESVKCLLDYDSTFVLL
ncbi:general odorant-binding protein 69a [Camponotus floridanus]|uniref:general odorant-binding protein 69a n=1 Tax=Camponotus floridanus TaxID=104421 RepID=UPI000DC686A2|nr:general odorant-binding protein 69a [Camponotus floridanus]